MALGRKQLELLAFLGNPGMLLVTPDRLSRSLVKRGLLREDKLGGCRINPTGLRALADALERGELDTLEREGVK